MSMVIKGPVKGVKGEIRVPSDKSVSHRALILGAISGGKTGIRHLLRSADTLSTMKILQDLGTEIEEGGEELIVHGRDYSFREPSDVLDAGNSGTTARIMMGVLATQPFFSAMTGDESLRKRPMGRVTAPLRDMGARIMGREFGEKLPIAITGGSLRAVVVRNSRASAQVKSAILLAGLKAEGMTEVHEPVLSRDHTERMLRAFGAEIISLAQKDGHLVKVRGGQRLEGTDVFCPADPSSASFIGALCALSGGEVLLREVLVNPTRDGFFRKLRDMGVGVSYENERELSGEPVADIVITGGSSLRGVEVVPEEVPSMIDEIPILSVVMALAEGRSVVKGAKELRVKESDRIKLICENLRRMGAVVEEFEDGFAIEGGKRLRGAEITTHGDHRIAMAFAVAGMVAQGETIIDDPECVKVSYPEFFEHLHSVIEYP